MSVFSTISNWNEQLASKITLLVGTMTCVYIFTIWSLIPLVAPSMQSLVFYSSSAILQLILLPVIMVGQLVLNRKTEARAEADHTAIVNILAEMQQMMTEEQQVQGTEAEEIVDLNKLSEQLLCIEALLTRLTIK